LEKGETYPMKLSEIQSVWSQLALRTETDNRLSGGNGGRKDSCDLYWIRVLLSDAGSDWILR
jgi:hypothetical protein